MKEVEHFERSCILLHPLYGSGAARFRELRILLQSLLLLYAQEQDVPTISSIRTREGCSLD